MRKSLALAAGTGALLLGSLFAGPAGAQTMNVTGPHNPYCGAWVSGTWTPNGNCVSETTTTVTTTQQAPSETSGVAVAAPQRVAERVSGTIIGVNGHMVTLQQSHNTLIVDDSRALSREDTGHVAVGRQITAHGYWESGTFYARSFT